MLPVGTLSRSARRGGQRCVRGQIPGPGRGQDEWVRADALGDVRSDERRGTGSARAACSCRRRWRNCRRAIRWKKWCSARDEIANMVWGLSTRSPVARRRRHERFRSRQGTGALSHLARASARSRRPGVDTGAQIEYRLGRGVPENWIPFIPVHNPGSTARFACSGPPCRA